MQPKVRIHVWSGPDMHDPFDQVTGITGMWEKDGKKIGRGVKLPDDYTSEDAERAFGVIWEYAHG